MDERSQAIRVAARFRRFNKSTKRQLEKARRSGEVGRARERLTQVVYGWTATDIHHPGVPQWIVDEMPDEAVLDLGIWGLVSDLTKTRNPWTPFDKWPKDARFMVYRGISPRPSGRL